MEFLQYILHFEKYLANVIDLFGPVSYLIIFIIIFAETGLVVTPFLPGDSLLFIIGTFAGKGFMNISIIYPILLLAAILGDTVNYWIGHHFGPRVFSKEKSVFFNKSYLEKTREFYVKHGGKTIILARFVPIIRTFAPFVAGIGKMHYPRFLFYNIIGAFLWITILTFAGYFFGSLPLVKNNFEMAVLGIIFISFLPALFEYAKHKRAKEKAIQTSYQEIQKTFKVEHLSD